MSPHTAQPIDTDEVLAWFTEQVGGRWTDQPLDVTVDGDEILVMVLLGDVDGADRAEEAAVRSERTEVIGRFREDTRSERIDIASRAETKYGRKVSWGARCGALGVLFTHLSVPAMTRLRIRERTVLDTLIDAGVARSRSDALAWCVRLVGRNLDEWLEELREALVHVQEVRARGPKA
jgi:hypothetical protein